MQTQAKFCLCFTIINNNFFSGEPKLPLKPKKYPPLNTIKNIFAIKCYSMATMQQFIFITIFFMLVSPNKQSF